MADIFDQIGGQQTAPGGQPAPAPAITPAAGQGAASPKGDIFDQIHAQEQGNQGGETPSLLGFGKNVLSSTGHLIGDAFSAVTHPAQTASAVGNLIRGMSEKSVAPVTMGQSHTQYVDALVDQYKNRYGSWDGLKSALYKDPAGVAADIATLAGGVGWLGKGVEAAADAAKLGTVADVAGTVSRGASAVGHAVDPLENLTRAGGAIASKVPVPEYLYRTALRPGYRADTAAEDVRSMVSTGLEHAIPVSEAGAKKLYSSLENLNDAVTQKVRDAYQTSGITLDRNAIADRLKPVERRFGMQVAPEKDLRDIDRVGDEFMRTNPPQIPADVAQAKKVGTYQQLQGKYGKISAAEDEAQKALARGIKEELTAQMPELSLLNEGESKLLNLQGVIERAVNKQFNRTGSMSSLLTGGAVGAGTHSPAIGAAAGVMKQVLADPNVRSRLAIVLDRARTKVPAAARAAGGATSLSRIQNYEDSLNQFLTPPGDNK